METLVVYLFAILQLFFIRSCTAVTCYGFDGGAFAGNVICPGSNACCGVNATCESNRLCHNQGDSDSLFVRGPCAVQPYDRNTCAVICLYDEVNGFLPRAIRCQDGSICCNNDPQCCGNNRGVFLDSTGHIVSSISGGGGTSSSSASATTSSTTFSTTFSSNFAGVTSTTPSSSGQTSSAASSMASAPLGTPDASSSFSTGTKVGLGVGIPLGVLVLGILIIIIWFQRRRIRAAEATANQAMSSKGERQQKTDGEQERRSQRQYRTPMQEMSTHKSPILKGSDYLPAELSAG